MAAIPQIPSSTNSTIVRSRKSPVPLLFRLRMQLGSWLAPGATMRRALDLFATPLPGSRERALRADSAGAVQKSLRIEGKRVAYYVWGDPETQPVALFSHGWSSFGLRIAPWVEALRSQGLAVVAFDQTGHGHSEGRRATLPSFARTLTAFARHFPRIDLLIGHSLGGTAATLALANGIRAKRVVLIAPAADGRAATRRFAAMIGLTRPVLRGMRRLFEQREGIGFDAVDAHRVAPTLGTPALIVHDIGDDEVPWEEGERYARFWPQARLLSTQGLGHHRILTDPQVIGAALAFHNGFAVGDRIVSTTALPYGWA